jgi:hypothetical protein
VYVDYDPVVLAHARALLTSHETGATEYIDAHLRDTGKILGQASELPDFTKPVAVTLHPWALVAKVMDAVAPGSYLAVSHLGRISSTRKRAGLRGHREPLGAAAVHRPHADTRPLSIRVPRRLPFGQTRDLGRGHGRGERVRDA